ncbi:unnamed protein product [Caenorhabditis brenneri]
MFSPSNRLFETSQYPERCVSICHDRFTYRLSIRSVTPLLNPPLSINGCSSSKRNQMLCKNVIYQDKSTTTAM